MKWQSRWKTAAGPVVLFAVNAYITLALFRIDYTRQMGSIEAAYVGLARYITAHFGDFQWFPLWYGGIPYQDTYPPLLHFVVAAVSAGARIGPGLAYHAVTAAVYALGPVALYWAARRLGAGRPAAFAAGLLYSLVSPSCWLVRDVRADSGGWFGPRRLDALVRYGEGPHLTALLLLPLAVGALHVALERRRPVYYVLAAMAMAAVVLSNWVGAFALAVAVPAYLLAGFGKHWRPRWVGAAAVGCYAYGVAMPWAMPSTIATIRANAPLVEGRFESGPAHKLFAAGFGIAMLLLAWAMKRWNIAPRLRFATLFLYVMAGMTLGSYWFGLQLLPQPKRYHLEMDLAWWLLVALALGAVAARWRRIAIAALVAACLPIVVHQRAMARALEQPIKIGSTVEYRISTWLGANLPGRRVFAPGTIGFWMNAFSDTPMLTGGFDNGMRNTLLHDVIYQVYAGDRQDVMLDWLKAFGCDALIGGGPESREVYHPYAHPEIFRGMKELWREGGDVVYEVPRVRRSLAHAIRAADLVKERPLGYGSKLLAQYAAALDDPALPAAGFRWLGASAAEIVADLRPEHLLSVQIAWDEGWTARVNGERRRAWGDKLGQMVVEPRCSGPCTVELRYDGGAEMRFARAVSGVALGGGLLWILLAQIAWRKHSVSTKTN
jgi:hypothetical protein